MRVPMRVLRLTAMAPAVLMGTVLAVVVLALLPPVVGLVGFLACVVVLVALALGYLERPTVRVLGRAGDPGEGELAVLAPLVARLGGMGIGVGGLYVARTQRSPRPAAVLGRSSVVVSRWLVEATFRGELSQDEAVALLAHAVGRHRTRPQRCALALGVWTAPWRGLLAVACRVGGAFAWFPLVRPAWGLRFVVGIVCVVQSAAEGRTVSGLIAGAFIALTYLVPAANRAIERRVETSADAFVLELGLGPPFVGLLRRGGWAVSIERLQRLQRPPGDGTAVESGAARPALFLVRA